MSELQPVRVFADAGALAHAAAESVVAHIARALGAREACRMAVPGGRSPHGMLHALAAPRYRDAVDWARVTVLQSDERALPPDHAESNARLVHEALLGPLGAHAPRFVRMWAEAADLEAAAAAYEAQLVQALDLLVLGLGEDGHVASLFPGSPLLTAGTRRVAAVYDSPKPPPKRMTLTPRALAEAHAVIVLASGAGKAAAVAAARAPGAEPLTTPAALVRSAEWLLDREAASRL